MTNLERLRLAHGLTQETVSGVVGIAVSTYSMYENGKRAVPRQIAERIAEAVSCKLEDIFLPEKFTVSKSEELMLLEPKDETPPAGPGGVRGGEGMEVEKKPDRPRWTRAGAVGKSLTKKFYRDGRTASMSIPI